jgi:hypothetical protein
MSVWLHLTVFIVALPVSVWLWATFMAIFDNSEKVVALIRFTASLAVILSVILVIGPTALYSVATALLTVILLHCVGFWLVRKYFVGIDTDTPAND